MNATDGFRSALADGIRRFLAHHRALGKRFENEENALRLLDRFLFTHGVATVSDITPDRIDAFLASRPRTRPRSYNHLVNVLQRLFRWLVAQDALSYSPMRARPRRPGAQPMPFLFDPAEVERLLASAARLRDTRHHVHRGTTYRMIFALMYGLGLRVSEATRLLHGDVDHERRCLHVRNTKFLKSRLVPFGPRMDAALGECLQARWNRRRPRADDPLFSLAVDGRRPVESKSVSRTFQRLVPGLDLTVPEGVSPPRLHCLRHSFAVSTLLGWYRAGVDPNARLLHLSTFLGHANPSSTAVYITITDALLNQASQRFERYAGPILDEVRQ